MTIRNLSPAVTLACLFLAACHSVGSWSSAASPGKGETCAEGVCADGFICVDAVCVGRCDTKEQCAADEVCVNSACVRPTDGCGDSNCAATESCGTCPADCGACPNSCDDEIQNQGELGTDCGGPCPACEDPTCVSGDGLCPTSCSAATDCDCDAEGARIIGVVASSDDGNVPPNALDGSLASRWSATGDGVWIALELSCPAPLDAVRVAFYKGDERHTTISVELSNDGMTWTEALAATPSSGSSLALESFSFPPQGARFVRIVGHGNDGPYSTWTSLTEIELGDLALDLACVPAANPCADNDSCNDDIVTGAAAVCGVVCAHNPITACFGGDDCCPAGCGSVTDSDCAPSCDDDRCEIPETCNDCPGDCGVCPSCNDGIQNQGETKVDCGGPCPACPSTPTCQSGDSACPTGCTVTTDCDCDATGPRVIGVTATSDDGNVPANAVDNSLGTRWTAVALDESITLELSCPALVDTVRIAFHKGNERQASVSIDVSTDGSTWSEALPVTTSNGTTLDYESFAFTERAARFARIVNHGNNGAYPTYISLAEVRVESFPISLACVPNANECGDDGCGGQHPLCGSGESCQSGTCVAVPGFDVVFSQNFNDDPTGSYSRSTWSQDWNLAPTSWSDPCGRDCTTASAWATTRLSIQEEAAGNRFLRHQMVDKGVNSGSSGAQWWVPLGNHEELYLSYRLRFTGNHWTTQEYHGKLPGLCGSAGCPGGGMPPTNYQGFSTRYMFHGVIGVNFYLYHHGMDLSDGPYGDGLDLLPYRNAVGQWHTLTERVVMNTPGQTNGIVEGFFDGVLVAQKTNMDYRNSASHYIATLWISNFLGGSGADPSLYGETPTIDFDDFVVYTYKASVTGIPRGLQPSPVGRVIVIPQP